MKFFGKVGFWMNDQETSPGVFQPVVVERSYRGDISKNTRRWDNNSYQNEGLNVMQTVSIVSDLFAQQNFTSIRYVVWSGSKLKVTSVSLDYPRITMEIGGPYDGENAA